ncbi:hypothetical protein IJT93_10275 [bacterium]|nr:hypothetical protein [bacterium]
MLNDKSLLHRSINSCLDKTQANRLQRIYREYRGACARLASQKNVLASPSAHQNRLFANALLESWSFHLLCSEAPFKTALPVLTASVKALPRLMSSLNCQELFNNHGRLSAPINSASAADGKIDFCRSCETETLKNTERSFISAAASLGLKSRERVNYLYLRSSEGFQYADWSEKLALRLQTLTRTRQKRVLIQEKGPEAYRQLRNYLEQLAAYDHSSVRIAADVRYFRELAAAFAALSAPPLPLPANSKIFIRFEQTDPPDYDERLRLKLALKEIFLLEPENIRDVWTDDALRCAMISCAAGYFHLPVTLRVTSEGLLYNPCIYTHPVLAKQTSIKTESRLICPCGIKAPIVK